MNVFSIYTVPRHQVLLAALPAVLLRKILGRPLFLWEEQVLVRRTSDHLIDGSVDGAIVVGVAIAEKALETYTFESVTRITVRWNSRVRTICCSRLLQPRRWILISHSLRRKHPSIHSFRAALGSWSLHWGYLVVWDSWSRRPVVSDSWGQCWGTGLPRIARAGD